MPNAAGKSANFRVEYEEETKLVIRDVGPWDQFPTVTNDAEDVVDRLVVEGQLPPGRRLFYIDSEGQMDQILVKEGKFAGFAPGPRV
jgi:hypothetical protein